MQQLLPLLLLLLTTILSSPTSALLALNLTTFDDSSCSQLRAGPTFFTPDRHDSCLNWLDDPPRSYIFVCAQRSDSSHFDVDLRYWDTANCTGSAPYQGIISNGTVWGCSAATLFKANGTIDVWARIDCLAAYNPPQTQLSVGNEHSVQLE